MGLTKLAKQARRHPLFHSRRSSAASKRWSTSQRGPSLAHTPQHGPALAHCSCTMGQAHHPARVRSPRPPPDQQPPHRAPAHSLPHVARSLGATTPLPYHRKQDHKSRRRRRSLRRLLRLLRLLLLLLLLRSRRRSSRLRRLRSSSRLLLLRLLLRSLGSSRLRSSSSLGRQQPEVSVSLPTRSSLFLLITLINHDDALTHPS